MRIYADMHHGALYSSLIFLLEKRLGHELYRPVGMEWYTEGYWNVYPHPDTAGQFLGLHLGDTFDKIKERHPNSLMCNLNEQASQIPDGTFVIPDVTNGNRILHKGITLEQFKETKFDILIASIPQHIHLYSKLIQLYQPQAKLIFQVGNAWGHLPGVKNIMASTAPFSVPAGTNTIFYHQEFDLGVFKYAPPTNHTSIKSYIHIMREKELRDQYRAVLNDWTWKSYGAGMEDGCFYLMDDIANEMKDSGWTWHIKPEGDGYGHNLFSSYACGRPLIVKKNYYRGKLAEKLMIDNVTCVDISSSSVYDNCQKIRSFSNPEKHIKMCEAAYNRFKETVNFEEDAQKVKVFLENLI